MGLSACEKPELIGASLLKGNQINTIYTDTLTVQISTVQLDSVRSSLTGVSFVGNYQDPALGKITAEGYLQFGPAGGTFADSTVLATNAKSDSLVLILPYFDGNRGVAPFYDGRGTIGDTLRSFGLRVHQLLNFIDTTTAKKTFLIQDVAQYKPSPLATKTFFPRSRYPKSPTQADTLRIRLPDALAKELFSKSLKPETASYKAFADYFKGLALVPQASNAAILSFDFANTRLRLHYRKADTIKLVKDFVPYNNHFNNVVSTKAGSKIARLTKAFDQIKASQSGGEAYMQNGIGVSLKFEIPYLTNLKKIGNMSINKAELVITPEINPSNVPIPPSTFLYETDFTNKLIRNINGVLLFVPSEGQSLSNTLASSATANVYQARQELVHSPIENKIRVQLTSYLQAILLDKRPNKGLLMLTGSDTDFARMILKSDKVKLQVYYTYVTN